MKATGSRRECMAAALPRRRNTLHSQRSRLAAAGKPGQRQQPSACQKPPGGVGTAVHSAAQQAVQPGSGPRHPAPQPRIGLSRLICCMFLRLPQPRSADSGQEHANADLEEEQQIGAGLEWRHAACTACVAGAGVGVSVGRRDHSRAGHCRVRSRQERIRSRLHQVANILACLEAHFFEGILASRHCPLPPPPPHPPTPPPRSPSPCPPRSEEDVVKGSMPGLRARRVMPLSSSCEASQLARPWVSGWDSSCSGRGEGGMSVCWG